MNTQKTFVHIIFLIILSFNLPAFGETSQNNQQGTTSDITSGLVGAIIGALTAGTTTWLNYRGKINEKKREEIARLRRDYLNPLKFAAKELEERLEIIITKKLNLTLEENNTQNKETLKKLDKFSEILKSSIHTQDDWGKLKLPTELEDFKNLVLFIKGTKYIKDYVTGDLRPGEERSKQIFITECYGGEMYFTASTLYLTVAYIAYANNVREKLPFSTLVPKYNRLVRKFAYKSVTSFDPG